MKRELRNFMIQYLSDGCLYKQFIEQYGSKTEVKSVLSPDCTRWKNSTKQSICNVLITDAARRLIREKFMPNL